jgi:hypothetical protein
MAQTELCGPLQDPCSSVCAIYYTSAVSSLFSLCTYNVHVRMCIHTQFCMVKGHMPDLIQKLIRRVVQKAQMVYAETGCE